MTRLTLWERGLGLQAEERTDLAVYLWFYEWTLWDAIRPGPHSRGRWDYTWALSANGRQARMASPPFRFDVQAVADGALLELRVANETDYPWPPPAAIIPCLNPGGPPGGQAVVPVSQPLLDSAHARTYFVGASGLERLEAREIHFNHGLRPMVDRLSPDGRFVFSDKWPTSSRDARAGLMIREAEGGDWVAGIAWERYVSAQGHNPWFCMHLSIRVGPLQPGDSRTIRGRLYLFQGAKDDCWAKYQDDFA